MGGRTVVKNTTFLYMRMIIMIVIAFFTSRILLEKLGISGYGIYNVVGGIVAMFSSLRGSFASSIQRFLNYEKGLGRKEELGKIFSMGVNIHLIICCIFLLIAETFGLWFLNNKLVIPADNISSANWVYQFSIATALVTIMTVPQDAVIIANQRMKVYVYISLLEMMLKLGVIFLIPLISLDSLVVYALLLFIVSVTIRFITFIYCRRKFEECKYIFFWGKTLFSKLGSFAGWNFLGNTAFSLTNEGTNFLLNFFGGPIANASRGITYQVKGAIEMFIINIQTASSPHLTEVYAKREFQTFFDRLYSLSKITFFVICILCIPIITYTTEILNIWLSEVPVYTAVFTQLSLYILLIRVFHGPIDTIFKADGRIKWYQIIDSFTLSLSVVLGYIFLINKFDLYFAFVAMLICEAINMTSILLLARKIVSLNIYRYLLKVIWPCIVVGLFIWLLFFSAKSIFSNTVVTTILGAFVAGLLSCIVIWFIGFTVIEREFVRSICSAKLKSFYNRK